MDRTTHCPNCFKEPKPAPRCGHCGFDTTNYQQTSDVLPLFTPLDGGKYRVGRVLGEGGFGVVYAGFDRSLDRLVAIKEFYPATDNPLARRQSTHHVTARKNYETAFNDWKNNFLREAKLLGQFSHPRVVQVHGVVEENNTAYLIMERLEGCPLSEYLGDLRDQGAGLCTGRTLSAAEGRRLLNAALEALDVLHRHQPTVIHRDLTPHNLFLQHREIDQLKVLDFGLARLGERQQGDASIAINVGNPGFASPEQLGYYPADITRATDFYTLGASLYTALAGKTPPSAKQRCTERPPPPLPPLPQRFDDPALAHVITACLEISPNERPQSVADIRRRLTAQTVVMLTPDKPAQPPPSPPSPSPSPSPSSLPAATPSEVLKAEAVTFPDSITQKKPRRGRRFLVGLLIAMAMAMAAVAGMTWEQWKNLPSLSVVWRQPGSASRPPSTAQSNPATPAKPPTVRRAPTYRDFQIIQDRLRDGSPGPALVVLPAGSFQMGSPEDEAGRDLDERQHAVRIEKPFALGQREITVGEFGRFVAATRYQTDAERNADGKEGCYIGYEEGGDGKYDYRLGYSWQDPNFSQEDDHPVVCVSWNDATAYIQWLSKETGQRYRLPTEAEWEYAARAGTTTARFWGDNPDRVCQYANVADQTAKETFPTWSIHECLDGLVYTAPVASYDPNRWKLHDMLGNVWEWTCSAYQRDYDSTESKCIEKGTSGLLVARGGSWGGTPAGARSAFRGRDGLFYRAYDQGFRVVRAL